MGDKSRTTERMDPSPLRAGSLRPDLLTHRQGVHPVGPTRGNKGERPASCRPRWKITMTRKSNPPREINPLNTALLAAVRPKPPGNLPPARVLYVIRKLVAEGYSDEEVSAGLAGAHITVAATELAHALKSVRDNRSARAAERAARKSAQQNAPEQTDPSAGAARRVSVRFGMRPASTRPLRDAGLDYLDGTWCGAVAPDKLEALRQFVVEHGGTLETA